MADVKLGYSDQGRKSGSPRGIAGALPRSRPQTHRSAQPATLLGSTSLVCALAALSACSPVPTLPPAPPQPAPDAGYISNLQPYRIQVGDILDVRLMLNPEL